MPRADDDEPPSENASAPSVSDVLAGGLGSAVERDEPAGGAGGALGELVPEDLRQSIAELRRPRGIVRACRWLLVAAAYSLAGAGLCYGRWKLFFGSSQTSCDAAVETTIRHEMETFIGPSRHRRAAFCWAR